MTEASGGSAEMRFGAHLSVAGGMPRALERASETGCDTLQIFVKSPRRWAARELPDEEVESFRRQRDARGISPVTAHASYLLNPATSDEELWRRSWTTCALELRRCARLGLDGLVIHPGSHRGDGARAGLERVVRALERVFEEVPPGPPVLLEVTAGQGTALGADLAHLAWLLDRLDDRRVGVCLDTCHLHAAGYALDSPPACERTLNRVEAEIGFDRVLLVHYNDSRGEAGSRLDRHAHIGTGEIGETGFRALLSDRRLRDIPGVLETPTGDDDEWTPVNLARLRALSRGEDPPPPPVD